MPISVFDEKPIRLSDMAKIVNVSRATVSRWAKVGSKDLSGRKIWLETVVHVGMFYTSMEAYGRFVKAMNSPETRAKILETGTEIVAPSSADMATMIRRQTELVARIARAAGIKDLE